MQVIFIGVVIVIYVIIGLTLFGVLDIPLEKLIAVATIILLVKVIADITVL